MGLIRNIKHYFQYKRKIKIQAQLWKIIEKDFDKGIVDDNYTVDIPAKLMPYFYNLLRDGKIINPYCECYYRLI